MTTLMRTKIVSSGYIGGPGVNVLHLSAGTAGVFNQTLVNGMFQELRNLWDSTKSYWTDDASFLPDAEVQEIDVESGDIIGAWTQTGWTEPVVGTSAGSNVSRGNCLTIAFQTDVWEAGKRLRGRMFMGPLGTNTTGDDGQIFGVVVTNVADTFEAITSGLAARLAVYHRPLKGQSTGGYYGDVITVRCNSKPGNLRSRRD
jgi:hypothetical protein